jgi:hypothetical protein
VTMKSLNAACNDFSCNINSKFRYFGYDISHETDERRKTSFKLPSTEIESKFLKRNGKFPHLHIELD